MERKELGGRLDHAKGIHPDHLIDDLTKLVLLQLNCRRPWCTEDNTHRRANGNIKANTMILLPAIGEPLTLRPIVDLWAS
jgi:hypothetical protein